MDEEAEPTAPFRSTTKQAGNCPVILGDCLAAMGGLGPASVDVVVTSPPYNLNLAYSVYGDGRADAEYLDWMVEVATAVKRVMSPDGSFFLNITGSNSKPWLPFELIVRLRPLFALQNHITWVKSIGMGVDSTGHFKPVQGTRFMHHNHEHVFHLTHDGTVKLDRLSIGIPFKDKSNIARRGHARDLRCRGNTWFIPYSTVKSRSGKFNHPATFPVELPLWCIYLHGKPEATVLDPFAGAGSTLVAAHYAGASCTGIELDPAYAETARQRLRDARAGSRRLLLTQAELTALLRPDGSGRGTARGLLPVLQDRVNKTTRKLVLTGEEVAQLRRDAAGPSSTPLVDVFARSLKLA